MWTETAVGRRPNVQPVPALLGTRHTSDAIPFIFGCVCLIEEREEEGGR
jgi:hypothetical protein